MQRIMLFGLALLALLAGTTAHGEGESFFLGLDGRDGLPQETVQAVLRDSRGLVWIATQGGLARWDGHRMRVFRHDPRQPQSLPGNHVQALAEDAQGRIWVGTLQAGVAAIAPADGSIQRYSAAEGLASDRVSALAVAPNGEVWVGHPGAGLSRIDAANEQASVHLTHWGETDQRGQVAGLAAVPAGLWIAGATGMDFLPWQQSRPEPVPLQPVPEPGRYLGLNAIDAHPDWPVAVAGVDGLWLQDPDSGQFHLQAFSGPGEASPSLNGVVREPDGTLWASSLHGLWRFQPDGSQPRRVSADRRPGGLPDGPQRSLYRDDQGLLWVGSESQGLWRRPPPPVGIRVHEPRYQDKPLSIWAMQAQGDRLWLGTDRHGVLALDDEGAVVEAHLLEAETGIGDNIWALADGREGLWVGTEEMVIHRVGEAGLENHERAMAEVDLTRAAAIWDLREDAEGRLWIATNGDGVHRYDPETGALTAWRAENAETHGLGDDHVTRIHFDARGRLWLGTEGSGLFMRSRPGAAFRHLPPGDDGLAGGMVESIREDSRGRIWVGSYDGGVARLSPEGEIRHWGEEQGLPDLSVSGLEVDAQDRVWVMTDRGLARIDPDGHLHRFDLSRGLPPLTMHVGAHAIGPDGQVLFGGSDGVLAVDGQRVSDSTPIGDVRITDLRLMGESVWAGPARDSIPEEWRDGQIELSHDQPALSLDYALDNLLAPAMHRYRHRLEGLESDWHYSDGQRATATYTNLDPGDYRFRLEAMGADGQWRAAATATRIRVHPAPWWSPGAKAAYGLGLLLVLGGGGAAWWRRRQKEAALQREREQRGWIEQLHALAGQLSEPADRETLLRRFLEGLLQLLPLEAASVLLERSGRLPPVRVALERPGAAPLSSEDAGLETCVLATGRRELGRLYCRPRRGRPLNHRDRAALAAATDQAAQAVDMFLLVAEADAANRAKSAFLAKLSHEIRTPVGGMLGLAGLMLRESLEPRSRDYAWAIQSSGHGLMAILSDILDHARIEAGRMELHPAPFRIVNAVDDTAALHAANAVRDGVAVITRVSRDIPDRIVTDEVRFRQILGNLLSNAVKFTRQGAITVDLARHDAGRLRLRVTDTGPGMSQEAARRLFQPFSRVEGSESVVGTGLGLVICRELAHLMGGDIRLETRPGEGSLFEVVFEAADDGGERPDTRCHQSIHLQGPQGPARQLLEQRLSEFGLVLVDATSPEAAESLHLVMDEAGLHHAGNPDQRIDWPLGEERLVDWLDGVSGHAGPAAADRSTAASAAGQRLLVAEDNPVNARVISDVLSNSGYRVDVVSDGAQALEKLAASDYALVLMDRHMPGMDGLAATRAIRESGREQLPVIGLTAAVSPEEHADCLDAGMDRVVVKDGNPGPMLQAVRSALT